MKDFRGPVESANLLTDVDSGYDSISAEAWKFLLLHGPSASGIAPWTEDNGLIIRGRATFVHVFVSKLVDVDPATTKGIAPDEGASTDQNLAARVSAYGATNPDAPIGYAVGSTADAIRPSIKTLAFQGFGQTCGYFETGQIPECAMRVTREGFVGPISSYAPRTPCDCYFESIATKQVPTECEACETDADCTSGDRSSCNYGFCELYRED